MRGLSIQSSALDALLNVLSREQQRDVDGDGGGSSSNSRSGDDALLAIIDEIKERMIHSGGRSSNSITSSAGASNIVTTALLEEVVAELSRDAKDVTDEAVQLLDAFRTPRLEYDAMRRTFTLVDGKQRSLYGEAVDKVRFKLYTISSIVQMLVHENINSFSFNIISGGHVLPAICTHPTTDIASRYFPTQAGGNHSALFASWSVQWRRRRWWVK